MGTAELKIYSQTLSAFVKAIDEGLVRNWAPTLFDASP
jgi:hypothetical protein